MQKFIYPPNFPTEKTKCD